MGFDEGHEKGIEKGKVIGRIQLLQQLLKQPETSSNELNGLVEEELVQREELLKRQLSGPEAGNGSLNPYKDPLIRGFKLSPQDRADLIAFLNSLTDEEVIHDPRFSNPWK